jgi:hypothetical protein
MVGLGVRYIDEALPVPSLTSYILGSGWCRGSPTISFLQCHSTSKMLHYTNHFLKCRGQLNYISQMNSCASYILNVVVDGTDPQSHHFISLMSQV